MTEAPPSSPRFNPARAGVQRVRIDTGADRSRPRIARSAGPLAALVIVLGAAGGLFWAQREGWIALPGLDQVLASGERGAAEGAGELLAAGAEPRAELRYAWPAEELALAYAVTIEPAEGSAEALGLRAEVTARLGTTTGAGDRLVGLSIDSLALTGEGAPAEPPAELRAVAEGFQGALALSSRGEARRASLDLGEVPAAFAPQLAELERTLAALVPPFPAEPVGPGTRWRAPMPGDETEAGAGAEHELVELDAETAQITTTLSAPELGLSSTLRRRVAFAGLVQTLDAETALVAGEGGAPVSWKTSVRPR
jgi:hypothetical protein